MSRLTTLPQLAKRINAEHDEALSAARTAIEHARRAGALLQQAKDQCGHGNWTKWVEDHLTLSLRTAQKYLRLAEGWEELEAKAPSTAHLTVEKALELLAEPKGITGPIEVHQVPIEHVQGTIEVHPVPVEHLQGPRAVHPVPPRFPSAPPETERDVEASARQIWLAEVEAVLQRLEEWVSPLDDDEIRWHAKRGAPGAVHAITPERVEQALKQLKRIQRLVAPTAGGILRFRKRRGPRRS
jgi:hypothetical protein